MQIVDPTGVLTFLATIPWLGPYLPFIVGAVLVCKVITITVPPPAAGSKLVGLYKAVSIIGLNIGFARNATPPGMPVDVRDASVTAAKIAAAAPERTSVATETTQKLVIHPGA